MNETIIDLIRHGEPVGGSAFRGHNIDDALSDKGWLQMWDAVNGACPWDHIASSPLSRCLSFARALAEENNIEYSVDDNLKEVGFGNWEGKTPDQIKTENLSEYQDFYKDPVNCRPPGAEPLDQFIQRTTAALNNLIEQHAGQHILIVAHAGVIRSLIASVLHATPLGMYKIKINNAGLCRIRFVDKVGTLEFINGRL